MSGTTTNRGCGNVSHTKVSSPTDPRLNPGAGLEKPAEAGFFVGATDGVAAWGEGAEGLGARVRVRGRCGDYDFRMSHAASWGRATRPVLPRPLPQAGGGTCSLRAPAGSGLAHSTHANRPTTAT